MEPHDEKIPRITVETEEHWLRVQANADAYLTQCVEARIATLPGGSQGADAKRLRPKLEEEVNKLRERMWEMAKPNLTVNGFPYEDFVQTTEPFDESLDRQNWSLNAERVEWEAKIRERRRHMPDQVFDLCYNIQDRRRAAMWTPNEADRKAEVVPEDLGGAIAIPPRHAKVKETFSTAVSHLADLVQTAPQQLERAKRVYVVQEEIARLPA